MKFLSLCYRNSPSHCLPELAGYRIRVFNRRGKERKKRLVNRGSQSSLLRYLTKRCVWITVELITARVSPNFLRGDRYGKKQSRGRIHGTPHVVASVELHSNRLEYPEVGVELIQDWHANLPS